LVLETDADYERFKVDKGRKDHWAMYACPPRIPLVYEPNGKTPPKEKPEVKKSTKPAVYEVLQTMVRPSLGSRTEKTDVISTEEVLLAQFAQFQDSLLKLRQRLARGNPDERKRAEALNDVLDRLDDATINQDFGMMVAVMRSVRIKNTGDLAKLKDHSE